MPTRSAAATRSSSAWPRASARRTGCCRRARPRPRPAATSSSGSSRPTAAPRRRRSSTGLEVVPRRRVDYRGTALEEMDLPAILARAPELVLIDELAHTNAPGVEHAKRYEDIADVLAAGIDVFSTVNVQHLESLNDRVAELTGDARARDRARRRDRRRRRDRARRPHPRGADRAPAGRQGLPAGARRGRAQPLLPDREPGRAARGRAAPGRRGGRDQAARLPVRARARAARHPRGPPAAARRRRAGDRGAPARAGQARPESQRVVRRAWRSAQRLDGELDLLYVRPPGREPSAEEREQLEALRRLAAVLGATCSSRRATTSPRSPRASRASAARTYVLMGVPRERRGLRRLAEPLPTACSSCCPASTCGSSPTAEGDHPGRDRRNRSRVYSSAIRTPRTRLSNAPAGLGANSGPLTSQSTSSASSSASASTPTTVVQETRDQLLDLRLRGEDLCSSHGRPSREGYAGLSTSRSTVSNASATSRRRRCRRRSIPAFRTK